jgi:hypothetical protein
MKLELTLYGVTHSIQSKEDGLNVAEVVERFKGLLVSAGYHPNNVDEYFNTEFTWFPEGEEEEEEEEDNPFYMKFPEDFDGKGGPIFRKDN